MKKKEIYYLYFLFKKRKKIKNIKEKRNSILYRNIISFIDSTNTPYFYTATLFTIHYTPYFTTTIKKLTGHYYIEPSQYKKHTLKILYYLFKYSYYTLYIHSWHKYTSIKDINKLVKKFKQSILKELEIVLKYGGKEVIAQNFNSICQEVQEFLKQEVLQQKKKYLQKKEKEKVKQQKKQETLYKHAIRQFNEYTK